MGDDAIDVDLEMDGCPVGERVREVERMRDGREGDKGSENSVER